MTWRRFLQPLRTSAERLREGVRGVVARGRAFAARASRRQLLAVSVSFAVLLVVGLLATRLVETPHRPETQAGAVDEPLRAPVACTNAGGLERVGHVVFGKLGEGHLSQVLRAHDLSPDDVYQARQALEKIPGFRVPDSGRFVASLDATSGALESIAVVIPPAEMYVATSDRHGHLVGERSAKGPEQRPCFGAMRVGGSFAETLRSAPFHHEIADALAAAVGETAASAATAPGTRLRIVARELVALGAFAGYDGFEAVEVATGAGASPGRRTYRFRTGSGVGYFDAEGHPSLEKSAALDEGNRAAFRARVTALDAMLERIAWPTTDPAAPKVDRTPEAPEPEPAPEPEAPLKSDPGRTVRHAAKESCSTRVVEGLSQQIIAEARCTAPDAFVRIPARPNLKASSNVTLFLEPPARDQLLAALDANRDKTMTVNSALRTIPQQVLLSIWGETKRCGVKLAAVPGESNHESGLALDIREASTWRPILEKRSFRWMGAKDPVHFDYDGIRAVDHRGLDVLAFQRLWNRNHPTNTLALTGHFDAKTAARIATAPASGFPVGARCEAR